MKTHAHNMISANRWACALRRMAILALGLFMAGGALAIDASSVPIKKQTTLGLYYTAAEAADQMRLHGAKTLFIDVRDPVEVNYVGMPSVADANVPFKFADPGKWHMKKKQFNMRGNPIFVADVDKRLAAKRLTRSDVVILMCRSGPRSAKAVNALAKAGYTNVYNMIEGFEGDAVKKGPQRGQRNINGWKNAGLAWDTPKNLDIAKMYGNPKPVGLKQ